MRQHAGLLVRVIIITGLVITSWWQGLNVHAEAQVEAGLKRALIAFAVARGLNGVISVAQGTEVAIQPAGLGVVLAPGQVLDPVNDLVEQFSSVMLVAAASLGLQRLLIGMSGWVPLVIALSVIAILWLLESMRQVRRLRHSHEGAPHTHAETGSRLALLLQGLLVVLLLLRFSVPMSALLSEGAYRVFLQPEYERSRIELEAAKDTLGRTTEELRPQVERPDEGLLDRTRRWFGETGDTFDVEKRIDALQATAAAVTRNIIDLIAIFVVQTVVLPLLFLWLGWMSVTRGLPRLWAATRPG
ncbi:MAG TPA: hypothetical protein VND91_10760 [Candidatus Saccharimonadia bacterium]|nr:hypothetical protein [Candidatus Saccharimonadia bacterium]